MYGTCRSTVPVARKKEEAAQCMQSLHWSYYDEIEKLISRNPRFLTADFAKSTFLTFDPDDEIEKYQNQEISAKLAQRILLFIISYCNLI